MMRKIKHGIFNLIIIAALLSVNSARLSPDKNSNSLENKFYNGNFLEYVKLLKNIKDKYLSSDEKLFLAEAFLRSGKYSEASAIIGKIKKDKKNLPEILAVKAMLYVSKGKLFEAKSMLDRAYVLSKESLGVLRGRLMYLIFLRDFNAAENLFHIIKTKFKYFSESTLYYKLGMEIYKYDKNIDGLSEIYRSRVKILRKKVGKSAVKNLRKIAKIFSGKNIKPFFVESNSDFEEIPLLEDQNGHFNTVEVMLGERKYRVIIDTGNMTGWIIHSRDLREYLRPKKGGRIIMKIGSESENLDGFSVYCKSFDFGNFKLKNLYGIYVPKPYSGFYDANLNPIYIKNRIVSLDLIKKKIYFRTEKRFKEYLEQKKDNLKILEIRWFGNRYPLIPVIISGVNTFAILETGADDISLRKDFVKKIGSPLIPKIKFLSNGKKFNYFLCSAEIQMGKYIFVRKNAQVWPLKKYLNTFNGFSADAVIGTEAFNGGFVISFIPKENKIIFEYEKRKI